MGLFISALLLLDGLYEIGEAVSQKDTDRIIFGTFNFTIGVVAIVFFLWKLLAQ